MACFEVGNVLLEGGHMLLYLVYVGIKSVGSISGGLVWETRGNDLDVFKAEEGGFLLFFHDLLMELNP